MNEAGRWDTVGVTEWFKNSLNNVNWISKITKANDAYLKKRRAKQKLAK